MLMVIIWAQHQLIFATPEKLKHSVITEILKSLSDLGLDVLVIWEPLRKPLLELVNLIETKAYLVQFQEAFLYCFPPCRMGF